MSGPRSRPQPRSRTIKRQPFGKIQIGEPDANSEYFAALRGQYKPLFLNCFFSIPHFPEHEFSSGEKYLIYGQKGTGKTSALRYLESQTASGGASEFLIFKKSLLEEIDIHEFSKYPLMVDEEEIQKLKHYHHTIKRLLILIIVNKAFSQMRASDSELEHVEDEASRTLIKRISNSSIGDVLKFGMDSIKTIFQSTGFDIEKIASKKLLVDSAKLIKRNNDDLLTFLCRRLQRTPKTIRIYLDEIHFAYRSEESLQQDAILVRDTLFETQCWPSNR
jgi:hypothetical protein